MVVFFGVVIFGVFDWDLDGVGFFVVVLRVFVVNDGVDDVSGVIEYVVYEVVVFFIVFIENFIKEIFGFDLRIMGEILLNMI